MKILYDNLVKSATINSLTENPEYAFTALKDSRLSRVARTVDDANQAIDFDLGSIKDAEYCAITKHNISESATVKLQAFENNPLVDSRVLEYKFEDNVLDTSGNGYNGTPTDITYAPGVSGQAAVFNGTSSRIECGALPAFNLRSEFSISIWCKIAANPISQLSIVGHINYNNYQIKLFENGRTNAVVRLNDGSFLNTSTSANLNDGLWHHLVMVYSVSNGFLRYYVDNILIGQEATSQLLTDNLVSLNLGFSDGRNLNGSIDEFRIFNRALTQEEITGYYETNAPYPDYEIDMEFQGDWILSNFSKSYRYWRLAIDDDNSDGYIQLGYAFLGTSLTMPGMNRSVIIPQKSNSVATKSMSGQLYGDRRLKYKAAEISCEAVTETERQEIRTFFDYVDVTLPFVLMIWQDDLDVEPPIYCSLTDELSWNKLDINGLLWSLSFKFEECF